MRPIFFLLLALAACKSSADDASLTFFREDGATSKHSLILLTTAAERRNGVIPFGGIRADEVFLFEFPLTGELCLTGEGLNEDIDIAFASEGMNVLEVRALAAGETSSCIPEARFALEARAGTLQHNPPLRFELAGE